MRRFWLGVVCGLLCGVALAAAGGLFPGVARAQTLSGADLTVALRRGGYVLVMAHPTAPTAAPTGVLADPENMAHERQLDAAGRKAAEAMGDAFGVLDIKVQEVFSSPTYRALETVRLTRMEPAVVEPALGDGAQGVQPAPALKAEWLRAKVNEPTGHGFNRLIVTQLANIEAAFGAQLTALSDGEVLVFQPYARGGPAGLVARIRIEDWPQLAG